MNTLSNRLVIFRRAALAAAALCGCLLFAGAPNAKADSLERCNRRLNNAEWRLHESIEYFGYYSREANHWRHERHEAIECVEHARHEWREHHRNYDRDRRDRDWDRN